MKLCPYSENSVIIHFANSPSREVLEHILAFEQEAKKQLQHNYLYSIPSYVSLVIGYDTNNISTKNILTLLQHITIGHTTTSFQHHSITVDYNTTDGLDLVKILQEKSLSLDEFIAIHTRTTYDIYSVGFLPNFAYLGNVDNAICTPRLATPRKKVAKGSVGIADCQTGVYPQHSPAGWNIIGITKNLPTFKVGDTVRFIST
jgi:KipI family sensor histidine kinase inhibitor